MSSSSLVVWEFARIHPGLVLVFVGVAGEGLEIFAKIFFKEWSKKHELPVEVIGAVCWIVLVFGLWLEFSDAAKSDNKVLALQQQIEHANRMRVSDLSFATNLLTIPNIMVDLRCEDDDEARLTMINLSFAFSMGGWRIAKFEELTNRPSPPALSVMMPFGIGIDFPKKSAFPNDKAEQAANLLYNELSQRGEAVILEPYDETNMFINTIRVVVGKRVGSEEFSNYFENLKIIQNWLHSKHHEGVAK